MRATLVLGSANFGLQYGIANNRKLSKEEVFEILDSARIHGVWGLDTARAYGDSEKVIGEYFSANGKVFNVITKLPNREYLSAADVESEVYISLENMNVQSVDFMMIHSYEAYKKYGDVMVPVLRSLCREGVIKRYGLSVYHREEILDFLEHSEGPMAFEFPLNLFDQRFLRGGFLEDLKSGGHFLFARSVFLQGLFFVPEVELRGAFAGAKEKLVMLRELSDRCGLGPACIALLFVARNPSIDGVILGVDSIDHLLNNVRCIKTGVAGPYEEIEPLLAGLEVQDEDIILPYRWNT